MEMPKALLLLGRSGGKMPGGSKAEVGKTKKEEEGKVRRLKTKVKAVLAADLVPTGSTLS